MVNSKKERKSTNKPVSIERMPPLIPAKSPKEIKEISVTIDAFWRQYGHGQRV